MSNKSKRSQPAPEADMPYLPNGPDEQAEEKKSKNQVRLNAQKRVGNNLRALRLKHDATQVAVSLSIGVTEKTYSNLERGSRGIKIDTLDALAAYYDVSYDELLGNSSAKDSNIDTRFHSLSREDRDAFLASLMDFCAKYFDEEKDH